ncbi:MAG TPA: 3-deoxy-D-manno-octulosonic acid kinase [Steroidobacteraceae bacterium]|nr:3-deoxy-D-manno-octulosonic acid kinase [Steroidobacteraceae bacterium]
MTTATGAMLADPNCLGNSPQLARGALFDPEFWRARGALAAAPSGRGATWFVRAGDREWVLRHYFRGGFAARVVRDRYWWVSEQRVRAFAEYRLLETLAERGLPVPRPVAAGYSRSGPAYRCDLITERIPGVGPLSAALAREALPQSYWRAVGAAIARLHRAGADHADLNAHNILIDARGCVSVIDFDRGRLRAPGPWGARNLERLHRSLAKLSRAWPPGRFDAERWCWLMAAYAEE